jgi:hypothetical protein
MHHRMAAVDELIALLRGTCVVALTGAGCSTESGIPEYRGVDTPPRTRAPIQHREFVDRADARRRYWARSSTHPSAIEQVQRRWQCTRVARRHIDVEHCCHRRGSARDRVEDRHGRRRVHPPQPETSTAV